MLDPFKTQKPRIFKLPAFEDVSNTSCPYVIPEEYLVGEAFMCHLVPETNYIASAHDLTYSFGSKCPAFEVLLGVESADFKRARHWFKHDKVLFYSKTQCSLYSVSLNPSTYHESKSKLQFPKLEDWYANLVSDLPDELNATTIVTFDKFIRSYGDHIITRCNRMGGMLDQMVAVDRKFVEAKGVDYV